MHDTITIGIPVLAILFGILVNKQGLSEWKADMAKMESRLESRLSMLERDYRDFFGTQAQQEARLDALEKKEISRRG